MRYNEDIVQKQHELFDAGRHTSARISLGAKASSRCFDAQGKQAWFAPRMSFIR